MLIYVLNRLVYGGLLYVLSVGLVLIFGLRRVVNFAHGQVGTFGVVFLPEIAAMIPLLVMVLVLIWRPEGLVRIGA
jgi:branched-chain amino acid transport system permease protein